MRPYFWWRHTTYRWWRIRCEWVFFLDRVIPARKRKSQAALEHVKAQIREVTKGAE